LHAAEHPQEHRGARPLGAADETGRGDRVQRRAEALRVQARAVPVQGEAMKAASLFAGLGGFDLALDRLGIATTVQAEIDRAAQRVLRARFPDARLEPDATRADLRGVQLVTAGFPCQGLSIAASTPKGRGLLDPTSPSAVVWETLQRVFEAQPDYLLLENSDALSTRRYAADAAALYALLSANGYYHHTVLLNAGCYGSAMRRVRAFVLCRRRPWSAPALPSGLRWSCDVKAAGVANQQGGAVWCAQPSVTKKAGSYTLMLTPDEVRTITPDGVEVLFGLPPGWTAAAGAASNRYDRLGNAVSVDAATAALQMLLGDTPSMRPPAYAYHDLYPFTVPAKGGTAGSAMGRIARSLTRGRGNHSRLELECLVPVYLAWMQAHPKTVSAKMRGYVEAALPLLPAPRPWPSTATVVMRQGRAVDRETADEGVDEEAVAEAAAST
jgi:site-specific DNA-cytosine methylase